MEFLRKEECIKWCQEHNVSLKNNLPDYVNWKNKIELLYPEKAERYYWFTQFIESYLGSWEECLLWVTTWGIWPSSENMHLYYKLSESYGNKHPIEKTPGLLAGKEERKDIISFLYLNILFGWDVYLFNNQKSNKIRISNDEIVSLSVDDNLEKIKKVIEDTNLRMV